MQFLASNISKMEHFEFSIKKCPKPKNNTTFTFPTFLAQNVKVVLIFIFLAIFTIFWPFYCYVEEIPNFQNTNLFFFFMKKLYYVLLKAQNILIQSNFHEQKIQSKYFLLLEFPLHRNKMAKNMVKMAKNKKNETPFYTNV